MKTQGFTLIELLAVIVILAIIALIATPIVLGIIDDTKESAQIRSAEMYLKGVANAVMKENLEQEGNFKPTECTITTEGNLDCDDKEGILEVEVDGEKPKNGNITFEEGKIKEVRLEYQNAIIVKNEEGNLVYGEAGDEEDGLAAGLYKTDGTFISWEQLTSTEYVSLTYYNEDFEEQTSGILNVDENGILNTVYCYDMCENLSNEYLNGKLVISNEVTELNGNLNYCENITDIVIPESITYIGTYDYLLFERLSSIVIDKNNPIYDSRDNCNAIIETATNTLLQGCKNTTIPNSITTIYWQFASGCQNIKSYIIPDNINCIGAYIFAYCSNLESITIPNSIKNIPSCAFDSCYNLTEINYKGTKSEWNSMTFENGWNNMCPEITVHCTDGDIVISANN